MDAKRKLLSRCIWACKEAPHQFDMYPETLKKVQALMSHAFFYAANVNKVAYDEVLSLYTDLQTLKVHFQEEEFSGQSNDSLMMLVESDLMDQAQLKKACRTTNSIFDGPL